MTITTIKKFSITEEGQTRLYRPGESIELEATAIWALENGYAEEAGEQPEARTMNRSTLSGKARRLGAPENADAAQAPRKKPLKRARSDDGTPVLGSEDEVEQDE